MTAERTLSLAGLWGAFLTVLILAMTVLMRLGTEVEAGVAVSTLPRALEFWARIVHRAAAMGVGVAAAAALVAGWQARPLARSRVGALAAVVLLTLALAAVGRYAPGYRFDLITVLHVAGGIALAAAFWWLRKAGPDGRRGDPVAAVALVLLLVLAAFGAAADAAAMRGERGYVPPHLMLAGIFVVLTLAAAWRARMHRAAASMLAVLSVSQFVLGFALLQPDAPRAMALAWTHAMIACALALLLAGLAARPSARVSP